MINDDNDSRTLSNSDSIIIPVTTDNNKLEWDGNPATIAGMLFEVERFFTRVGLFQVLISDRAVALSNGKLAIEEANTMFTKAMKNANDFHRLRRIVMNEQ